MNTFEQLYKVHEVCDLSRLKERVVRQMIADGRLRAVRLRGVRAIRVPASALAELIAAGPTPHDAEPALAERAVTPPQRAHV